DRAASPGSVAGSDRRGSHRTECGAARATRRTDRRPGLLAQTCLLPFAVRYTPMVSRGRAEPTPKPAIGGRKVWTAATAATSTTTMIATANGRSAVATAYRHIAIPHSAPRNRAMYTQEDGCAAATRNGEATNTTIQPHRVLPSDPVRIA